MSPHVNHPRGVMYATITAVMWGLLAVALKVMLNSMDAASVVFARFSIAFIVLFAIHLYRDPSSLRIFRKPPMLLPVASAFLAYNYYGFMKGLQFISPASSQVYIQIGPVLFALGGIFLFKEKVSPRQWIGFLVLVAGFALYYIEQVHGQTSFDANFGKGIVLILTGGLAWSVFALLQKKLLKTYKASDLNLFIYGFCAILFLPFFNIHSTANLSAIDWANLVFLGLNTLIAYNSFALAMHYTDANRISVIVTINPILTFVLMYILGIMQVTWIQPEHFTWLNISGALLALTGVLMVVLLPQKKLKPGEVRSQ